MPRTVDHSGAPGHFVHNLPFSDAANRAVREIWTSGSVGAGEGNPWPTRLAYAGLTPWLTSPLRLVWTPDRVSGGRIRGGWALQRVDVRRSP